MYKQCVIAYTKYAKIYIKKKIQNIPKEVTKKYVKYKQTYTNTQKLHKIYMIGMKTIKKEYADKISFPDAINL